MFGMPETVSYATEDGVALVTFKRPERNNAMTREMKLRYFELLDRADTDPAVRVVVLTGAGKSFCVGADTQALAAVDPARVDALGEERAVTYPLTTRKPIVCAINGPCAGVGLVHALCCDIRFAAAGAKMTTAFARRGLIAEYGISWLLPRMIGVSRAFDLIVSGRVIRAEEALQLGVVNRVLPREELLPVSLAYARDIASNCSPRSMSVMKRQIYEDLGQGLTEAYERAYREMKASLKRPDLKEGVASFLEKRSPRFPPLE